MKKSLLFLAALFCSFFSYAINVSGLINSNTIWTKANSPYIVTGDIDVDTSVTLTIEPGVQVRFDGNYAMYIDGRISAKGTATDSIYFTYNKSNPVKNSWKGINIRQKSYTDTSTFYYCHFQYADIAISSLFRPAVVRYSVLETNNYGILSDVYPQSYVHVSQSNFINNYLAFRAYGTGTFINNEISYCNTGFEGACNAISNNIHHCGIGIRGGKEVYNNIITYCSEVGLRAGNGPVTYNQIWHCKTGIETSGSASIEHNGLKYNQTGIHCFSSATTNSIRYNCIDSCTQYAFKNVYANVNVSNNYWGETDSSKIAVKVLDFFDDFTIGKVLFTPVLQSPDSGCAASINLPNNNPTVITSVQNHHEISVYPNPAGNSFTIHVPNNKIIKEVSIYNLIGKEVIHTTANTNKLLIDASSLSTGIYLYKVSLSDNSIVTGKVMKE